MKTITTKSKMMLLLVMGVFMSATIFAQITTVLPNNAATSGNARAPMGNFRFERAVYLITATEMATSAYPASSVVSSLGWTYSTAPTITVAGNLNIYLENTADVTNTKSTNWATAISTMTLAHSAAQTLPASTGSYDVMLTGTPFTYTGGGVYVAFEWSNPANPLSTLTIVSCNNLLVNGLKGAQSDVALPTTTASSSFRPETRLGLPLVPCSGTPAPGNTISSSNPACSGSSFTLSLQNATTGTGVSYQWQTSPDNSTWTNAGGASTNATYFTSQVTDTYYRATVTCSAGPATTASNSLLVTMQGFTLPETFGGGVVPPGCWTINNATYMFYNAASAYGSGTGSIRYNFYNAAAGTNLDFTSPVFTPTASGDQLSFDEAYATYSGEVDQLLILTSTDGGATYSTLVTYNGGTAGDLNTGGTVTSSYVPASGEWQSKTVTLPTGTNRIIFEGASQFGNDLFVDNINIVATAACAGAPATGTASATSTTICGSGTTTLSLGGATSGAGISYQWQQNINGGGFADIAGATTTAYISPTLATDETIDYRAITTCSNSGLSATSNTVTVTVYGPVTISPSPITICAGSTQVATVSASGATYSWSGGLGSSQTATISATGTYTVTVTQGSCIQSPSVIATVYALPTVTASVSPNPVCNGSDATLTALASTTAIGGYCAAGSTTDGFSTSNEYIGNFTFNTINNTSTSTVASGGYVDYTAMSTAVTAGSSYTADVLCPNYFTGDQFTVWIDYNQDGVFTDATEKTILGGVPSSVTPATASIMIPATALNGPTRVRVRVNYTEAVSACGSPQYGEVEDYTIVVSGGVDGATYAWSPSTFLSATTGASVTAMAVTSAVTYSVIASQPNTGCSSVAATAALTLDATPPVISCPADANISTDAGMCTSSASIGTATATDDCSVSSVTVDNAGPYAVGSTMVTWTATDNNGNTATCTQMVNVTDSEMPVITCPATANISTDAGMCTSSASIGTATATDNCSVSSVTVDNAGPYSVGSTTVTWTATDASGNMSTCTQMVNVTDSEMPVITCPADANISTDAGMCTSSASIGTATATDNCSVSSVTVDNAGPYSVGSTMVTWTATDASGNMSTCTQMVNVTDSEMPVITCPATANISTDAGMCTSSASIGTATATDNCSVSSVTVDNAGPYSVGSTTVTWTATDASGNMSTCTQMVNVTDSEMPVITCPADANISTDAGMCTSSASIGTATATDNCSVSSVTVDNAGPYSVGSTTVTWTATDASGNMSTCTQMVNVTDSEMPVITCPATANISTDAGMCTSSASIGTATATDNCSVSSVTVDNAGPYSVGSTTVTWTATDASGNMSTCTQMVNVTDSEMPVITCPATANISTDAGMCTSSASIGTATATDNCSVSSVTVDNAGPYSVGSTTVTWTATDASGNMSTCTQMVNVTDSEMPVITCPATANISTDAGMCTSSASIGTATATDNCSVSSVTVDNAGPYSVGSTTVTWTATDASGNMSTCTQIVNVTDSEMPVITCPATANISTDAGMCTSSASIGTATATDNCSVSSVTVDNAGPYSVGSITVTWTATDASGNMSTCTQIVNVTDSEMPVITCPATANISTDAGMCTSSASIGTATATDNCSVSSVTVDNAGPYSVGSTTVTWTATDASGNMSTCTQLVNVTDAIPPTITAPADVNACTGTTINIGTATASDNCGTPTVTNDAPGSFPMGTTVVTWTATDGSGNTATATQNVTVNATPVGSATSVVICNGTSSNVPLNSTIAGTTFTWTSVVTSGPGTVIGNNDCSSGCGTIIADVLTNTSATTGVVEYTVIPTSPAGCAGTSFTVDVTIGTVPTAPVLTGPFATCGLSTVTYTASSTYGTTYTWTTPTGITILSGQGTSSITCSTTGFTLPGNMTCTSSNNCGTSTTTTVLLTKKPAAPAGINGPATVCGLTTAVYSVSPVFAATSYNWHLPAGMSIISGAGTTAITVSITPSLVSGNMRVDAVNGCGYVAGPNLLIIGHGPLAPVSSTGPLNVCGVTTATYTVPAVNYATGYLWTVPSYMVIDSGQGTTSLHISVTGTPASGAITVGGTNACGTGALRAINLTITAAQPLSISGPGNVCGMSTATYTTPALPAAPGYIYNWATTLIGWSITGGQGTTSITISGPPTGTPTAKIVNVTSTNTCGSTSLYKSIGVTGCHSAIANNGKDENGNTFSELYPNPATTEFKLDVTTDMDEEMTVQMYDVLGNLVISQKAVVTIGTTTISTNIENYKAGIYFVRLVDKDATTVYSQTVIKN